MNPIIDVLKNVCYIALAVGIVGILIELIGSKFKSFSVFLLGCLTAWIGGFATLTFGFFVILDMLTRGLAWIVGAIILIVSLIVAQKSGYEIDLRI